jgi:HPt (histidine-containing phosphotransfer) domain-containing protein
MTTLDGRQVADLLALDKGKGALLSAFVNALATSAADRIEKINAHALTGDCAGLADQAHALRGSAGNLGAVGLAALLEQIEAAAKRQDIASAREFIARLEAEYAAAHQALRAACDGKS